MMVVYSMKYCSKEIFKDGKPREFKTMYDRDFHS